MPIAANNVTSPAANNVTLSAITVENSLVKRVTTPRKKGKRPSRRLRQTAKAKGKPQPLAMDGIPMRNTSYGLIVGPFGGTEESVLGWSAEKRKGTCDRGSEFARLAWSRSFVLVIHELSMTGAPLSMMELGTEILSCGGGVTAVVLSRKGGLMGELERRGIRVLQDKAESSYKAAMKADLVIAGSAVCSSWIEPYLVHNTAGSSQIVWWIMENRREYFDRSKHLLNRVKTLIFLSNSQSKQWSTWCEEEHIQLNSEPKLVPLSVNDELAFVAGIPCSLNTAAFSVENMVEKREMLRSTVRKEMGLDDNDMVVMSLSSINPGKGQRLLLESALLVAEHNVSLKDPKSYGVLEEELFKVPQNQTILDTPSKTGILLQKSNQSETLTDGVHQSGDTSVPSKKKKKKKTSRVTNMISLAKNKKSVIKGDGQQLRKLLSERESRQEQNLKVLIGSIGSKSNKVLYVRNMLRFVSQHSNMSKSILWTPTTTHVAPLYAAADVYVINAQGLGETFGRVTIEAMAFGLPILGTDAGGTHEIVNHGVEGLLHPIGREGVTSLAENIQYLQNNQTVRKKMGARGRLKVQNMYLKHHMYRTFAAILVKCLKPK